jgi:hypothetical protein
LEVAAVLKGEEEGIPTHTRRHQKRTIFFRGMYFST